MILLIERIFTFLVFSHAHYKTRLYDIIRKSVNKDDDQILVKYRLLEHLSSTTSMPSINEQFDSMKSKEQIKVHVRDTWDSEDDYYFKWAALNRRPMESLAGRKRSIEKPATTKRQSRINTGIWRSGLVG